MPGERPGSTPVRVGVSQCLLGREVRYDGGHKLDRFITEELAPHVELVPVCPELELGMGVPREAVRLGGDPARPRMIGVRSGRDWTAPMVRFSRGRVRRDDLRGLDGFILKKDSPSCGLLRVKIYGDRGMPRRVGVGIFARALREHAPWLPIEEEGRLRDPHLRENFIERLFAHHRLRRLLADRPSRGRLVRFHTAHKYLLLSHSRPHYTELGRLVAAGKRLSPTEQRARYATLFMEALAIRATRRKQVNVLQHILGFLKTELDAREKSSVTRAIEDYRAGLVPLIVPLTLLKHFIAQHEVAYILDQVYLSPHPRELMLRNHV